jgi:diguanylate cyclase (GGDEF)-like protein
MIAQTTASAAWQEAERMQRELQSRFAVMGLGRSGALLEASVENYLGPAKHLAESLSREYENLMKSFSANALPMPEMRADVEQLVKQQATIAEDRLRRDAEASGLGYQVIQEHMDSQRDRLVSAFIQALEIAEKRRQIALEQSWPTFGSEPAGLDQAQLTCSLFSRNALDRDLGLAVSFADRNGIPISVVMIDIDDFKKINDSFGHGAGDQVLLSVAAKILLVVGAKGRSYRYGGEEFVLLLPNASAEEALVLAERLRREVEALGLPAIGQPVTISVGIGSCPPCTSPASLVELADRALYEAKQRGKNRVMRGDQLQAKW